MQIPAEIWRRNAEEVTRLVVTERDIIADWLEEQFVARSGGQPLPQQLVGLELAYDKTWVYFTISANREQELLLESAVMQSYNRERGQLQINQVQRLWAAADDRLTFTDTTPQVLWTPAH